LTEKNIKFAFAVTNYMTNEQLNSKEFVEWELYIEKRENLKTVEKTIVQTQPCTKADYDSFYPINSA